MTPQSVSQGRKFGQVVEGAAAIFLRDGYAGASVDDIARAAGVSKATLYSYFPDKSLMFEEAMRSEVARLEGTLPLDLDARAGPERGIPEITARIAAWLADPAHVRLYRVHMAEAGRFGAVAGRFHEAVSGMLREGVRVRLDGWTAAGLLLIEDTDLAAAQLVALAGAGVQEALLLGQGQAATEAAVRATAARAASLFLRAHAPAPRHALRRSAGAR